MKRRSHTDYQTSLILQGVVLFPTIFFYLVTVLITGDVFIFGLIFQFLLGVTQVLSGLRGAISFQDQKRAKYTMGAVSYVIGLIVFFNMNHEVLISHAFQKAVWITMVLIIPVGIAIWYYWETWKDKKLAEQLEKGTAIQKVAYQEDLLDDMMTIEN